MEREPSRRRFITGCCVAGAGALAAGGLAGGATAEATGQGDAPPTRWRQTYDGGTSLDANGVAPTSDGYVAVGTTEPDDDEIVSEIWVAEVDVAGQVVWEQTFSERAVTEGFAIESVDEGFIVAGHTHEAGSGAQSGVALRIDGDGVEQWRRVFDVRSDETDTLRSVTVGAEGQFVFAGWTSRFDDAWVAKLDDTGGITWMNRYGPGSENRYHGVTADSGGGYVVVGETVDTTGDTAGWVNKLDSDGVQQFSQQFKKDSDSATNPKDDLNVFYDVDESREGFVAVGANAFDPETNEQNGWALEFNVNGGKLWDKRYSEENYTELRDVRYGNLDYYVVGETATDGDGTDARGYAANLGIDGDVNWSGTWGSGSSEFSAFHLTNEDGLVTVGSTASSAGGDTDGWALQVGGEEVATPSPTATPTPTATPADDQTPTFTPTPTDDATATDATGGGTDSSASTPTDTPADDTETPGDGGPATTAAPEEGGGISPTALGIGAVILALGGGGLLYNRFLAGGSEEDGPDSGQGASGVTSDGPDDGGDAGEQSGATETKEPATDENEDVQSAQTVVEGSENADETGGEADDADAGDGADAESDDVSETDAKAESGAADTDSDTDGADTDSDTDGSDTDSGANEAEEPDTDSETDGDDQSGSGSGADGRASEDT